MPAAGLVSISVAPYEAIWLVHWLRTQHQPTGYQGLLGEYLYRYRDYHDVDALARKFEKLVARKRRGGRYTKLVVQISREDATWLAQRVRLRRGLFGAVRPSIPLPTFISVICYRCLLAVSKPRGRRRLTRERLRATLARPYLDERHRKRLRKRQREESAIDAILPRLIARAILRAEDI